MKKENTNRYKDVPKDPNWELPTFNYDGMIVVDGEGLDLSAEAPFLYKDFYRVLRGGTWRGGDQFVSVSDRFDSGATYRNNRLGFRFVLQKGKR